MGNNNNTNNNNNNNNTNNTNNNNSTTQENNNSEESFVDWLIHCQWYVCSFIILGYLLGLGIGTGLLTGEMSCRDIYHLIMVNNYGYDIGNGGGNNNIGYGNTGYYNYHQLNTKALAVSNKDDDMKKKKK